MKKLLLLIAIASMHIGVAQNNQEHVYIDFLETYNDKGLGINNNTNCPNFPFDNASGFSDSFKFQIKEHSRVGIGQDDLMEDYFRIEVHGDPSDKICNPIETSRRAEAAFTSLTNASTVGWYKLKFYIDQNFRIATPSNSKTHNILQIINNETNSFDTYRVRPLPQFLVKFDHEASSTSNAVLTFQYGLEFRVKEGFIDPHCDGCPLDPTSGEYEGNNANCLLNSQSVADLSNQYYGGSSRKDLLTSSDTPTSNNSADYGWNELVLEVRWSDHDDPNSGYMDIWLNGEKIVNDDISYNHTFEGPNVYNHEMLPFKNIVWQEHGPDQRVSNIMKFGHYRYISDDLDQTNIDSSMLLDYFLADDEDYNIENNFETNVNNDSFGVLDLSEDIICDEVHNADEFVFVFNDGSGNQYTGNPGSNPHILTYDRLFSTTNVQFYQDYDVQVRAKFYDGFNGKYSTTKQIRLEPDTKLSDGYYGTLDVSGVLRVDEKKAATEYVLHIVDISGGSSDGTTFYHGVPDSGEIAISTLFANLNLSLNIPYQVKVRAKFVTNDYDMQGNYGIARTVTFTSSSKNFTVYPNPTHDNIYIDAAVDIQDVEVYNAAGYPVNIPNRAVNTNELNLQGLKSGIYFLVIKGKKSTERFTIIKE